MYSPGRNGYVNGVLVATCQLNGRSSLKLRD